MPELNLTKAELGELKNKIYYTRNEFSRAKLCKKKFGCQSRVMHFDQVLLHRRHLSILVKHLESSSNAS